MQTTQLNATVTTDMQMLWQISEFLYYLPTFCMIY
jgi:hypothetical protein